MVTSNAQWHSGPSTVLTCRTIEKVVTMRKLKWVTTALVAIGVLGLTAACSSAPASDDESGADDKTVGVLILTAASEVNKAVGDAVALGGEELGWTVVIGDGQGKPATAAQILQGFVNDKVDAIVTVSIEPAGVLPQLQAAQDAGIPIISAGFTPDPETDDIFDAIYAPDMRAVGETVAEAAIEAGTEPGTVLAQTLPGSYNVQNFVGGALETFRNAAYQEATAPVNTANYAGSVQSTALTLLQGYPEAEVFVGCCSISSGILNETLKSLNRSGVTIIGVYDTATVLDLIRNDAPILLAAPDYVRAAFIAVDQLKALWDGGAIDPSAADGAFTYQVIDADNVPASGLVYSIEEIGREYFDRWAE